MLTVRRFRESDAERASAVICGAFKSFLGDRFIPEQSSYTPQNLLCLASVPKNNFGESAVFVAEEDGNIVGVVGVSASARGLGSFNFVGVDPGSFSKGIGNLLMETAENFWKEKNQRKVSTCVSAHNKKALIYYLKHDFIPEGYQKDHFFEGVDEIILGRFLKKS